MTCIIAYTNGKNSFIAGDKLGSNGFTKSLNVQPKIFEQTYVQISENKLNKTEEKMALGICGSFRMMQLLEYMKLPEKSHSLTNFQYLVQEFIPVIRKLFKDEWGEKDNSQDIGGGNFLVLMGHEVFEIQCDFSVLQSTRPMTAVGSGEYHAIAAMQAFLTAEGEMKPERVSDVFKIVSDVVSSVSAEHDILKY